MWRLGLVLVVALGGAAAAQGPGAQAPLPDRDGFLAAARERIASNQQLQSRYTYKERKADLRLNPFGRMGAGPVELYEVFPDPARGVSYRRLVARDGVPVPAADVARQDREFLAGYEKWRTQMAREGADQAAARRAELERVRREEAETSREVLALFTFELAGRDTLDGEPAIIVRFDPVRDPKPRSREAKVASRFAGRAWVHETDHEMMRLEAEAIDDVSFGWGIIARLHKGARVVVTRRRVGAAWLPAVTTFEGTGRALLFRKVVFDYTHEYFDYEPFDPTDLPARLAASAPRNR
ncbi:MAG: hypothetical protein AB7H88_06600 [Vicinamibacterales bacterium]